MYYVSSFIVDKYSNAKNNIRVFAYTIFIKEMSNFIVLDKFSEESLTKIARNAILRIDSMLIKNVSSEEENILKEINQIMVNMCFCHGSDKVNKLSKSASFSAFSKVRTNDVYWCKTFNSNKKCNEPKCSAEHICKICYSRRGDLESHMPESCPLLLDGKARV